MAALAAGQHRVVSRDQLGALGFGRRAIQERLRSRHLHRRHSGVYSVGTADLTRLGHWHAAVLAGGDDAVLSHRDAGAAHAIFVANYGPVNVTVPRKLHDRAGLRFHHRALRDDEVATVDGIPATSVARTIFDLAASEPARRVRNAIDQADMNRTLDLRALEAIAARSARCRGVRAIRAILANLRLGSGVTREELEALFMDFLVEIGAPLPDTNVWMEIAGRQIQADCVWREERVIAELDSWGVHGTRRNFESDRERDRRLVVEGWLPIRVTWRHLHHDRAELAADIHRLLGLPRRRRAS